MDRYYEFFRFDEHAHLTTLVIYLNGLFESNSKSLNFTNILKAYKKTYPRAGVKRIESKLRTNRRWIKKLIQLRNEAIGHKSMAVSFNDAFRIADLKYTRIRKLIELALEIVNTLLRQRKRPQLVFWEYHLNHVRQLFTDLGSVLPPDRRSALEPYF